MADLTGFDLNLLRVFAAVMRERSATRAGERIGLSQPAVSAALGRLRWALGDQLFVRRGNEMVPTPRAEDLIGPVTEALDHLERALQGRRDFDPARAERSWTLLGADFFSLLLMPALAEQFARCAPAMRLRLLDSGRAAIDRMLQDDAVDLVLEAPLDLPEWVASEPLFHARFCVVARADLPALAALGVAAGDAFPLDSFCELPHALRSMDGALTGLTDDALAAVGRARRVTLSVPHFQAVLLAAARGGTIGVVPRSFAEVFGPPLGLALFEPPVPLPAHEIRMYWHSRHDRTPAHRWLRRQVVEVLGGVLGEAVAPERRP
jgi:DNA-binding transcriptional LysR family regulator